LLFVLVLGAFFFYFIFPRKRLSFKTILFLGIIGRLILFGSMPNLSDDLYRFIWDGELIYNEINPYAHTPNESLHFLDKPELYKNLNSKNYYSVYPPMMQASFLMSTYWGDDIFVNVFFFRLLLLISEIGILLLLVRILRIIKSNETWVAIYAFNPLIILEVIGNLHFESMMICFFLFGFYLLIKSDLNRASIMLAALFFAFGICTKLTLALVLPVLLFRVPFKKFIELGGYTLVFSFLLFLPFMSNQLIQNISSSLDLYFRSFEFNASIFYLVNGLSSLNQGWDTVQYVGPIVSFLGLLLILYFSVFREKKNWIAFFEKAQIAYFIYLVFSTTVHPWYLINLIFLSVFTRKVYPLVWSFLVFLSYYMYANDLREPPLLLALEYSTVFIVFYFELFRSQKFKQVLSRVPLFQEDDNPK
ncbi:MAG: hypothetical protein AAF487_09340, partial [Bacteroidota bacterium]